MENNQIIHEFFTIMGKNQYRGGTESNKRTVLQLDELMDLIEEQFRNLKDKSKDEQ